VTFCKIFEADSSNCTHLPADTRLPRVIIEGPARGVPNNLKSSMPGQLGKAASAKMRDCITNG
jgi:hypothetical protein